NRIIDDALEVTRHRWESQAQKRGVSYQVDKRLGQDVVVKGMHAQLVDAIANLVRNALDAMDQGGRLSFETSRSGGLCRLAVRDEGRGMTPDEVEQVFAPFFTTKGSEGTGLGMTVVQDIIKSHQGTITIESTPGVGTTFRIELPVFKEGAKSSRDSGDHQKVDTLNLLVVDDDHIILDVVSEALEDAGHRVDSFSHGSDAIDAIEKNEYNVVVTDLGMPDVTGWEVARAAKMHQPQIPVVVISGWGAQFNDDQLGDSGVDAMLAKPFHLQLLRETIERLAKGEPANGPTVRT
ncbi:MAG: response regulator, partial [candidate division Zixibacteria bacterium]|nr:response regulator [candidate division Zixibacteria bacterium]